MLNNFDIWAEGLDHPEGVAVGSDGSVYAGGEAGQVYTIDEDGAVAEIAQTGGFILGLAIDGNDNIYVCDLAQSKVLRIDATTRSVSDYSTGSHEQPMRTPNYLAFDAAGNLYVTDSGTWMGRDGVVHRVAPDGTTSVWSTQVPSFPNGCCLAADASGLLVVESNLPGVSLIPFEGERAGEPQRLVEFDDDVVPDGVAACQAGGFIVACYRPDRLYYVDPSGSASILAHDPHAVMLAAPTNVAFAGPDRRRLVVSSLGRWHLAHGDIGMVGAKLAFPQLSTPA